MTGYNAEANHSTPYGKSNNLFSRRGLANFFVLYRNEWIGIFCLLKLNEQNFELSLNKSIFYKLFICFLQISLYSKLYI